MPKQSRITKKRNRRKAFLIKDAADIVGISQRQGQRVEAMDSKNEKFVAAVMMLDEGYNLLLKEVKRVIPFI